MKVPVLIPRIFDHPHTYLSEKYGKLKTGSIVSVPFGKEEEIGVVWDLSLIHISEPTRPY